MRSMDSAPRDGTRILLRHWPKHYGNPVPWDDVRQGKATINQYRMGNRYPDWHRTPEPKWEEVHWVSKKEQTGSEPHWEEWTGDPKCSSSNHIHDDDCIGWLPLPAEPAPPVDQETCEHDWRYDGYDRGGSHKGEDHYTCTKCKKGEYRP